ncbi:MAG: hypothetical protein P8178_17335 [Candidatus Thiodiazotropha sp.]|jgi:hypothetical protein
MMASTTFLSLLVGGATVLAALTPIILIALWIHDLLKGRLW